VPVNRVSSGEEVTMQDILGWAAAAKTDKERDYWLNVASDLAESRRNT